MIDRMISGRPGCNLVVLAVLCVPMVFLFPAVQGPYSVVHGPATALQAARAVVRLRVAIAQAALGAVSNHLVSSLVYTPSTSTFKAELRSVGLSGYNAVLRC
jgi:hypothetical protein